MVLSSFKMSSVLLLCSLMVGLKSPTAVAQVDFETLVCGDVTCSNQGSFYTYKYGESITTETTPYENQVGDLFLPSNPIATPIPIVVLLHGGYWGDGFRRKNGGVPPSSTSNMQPLAEDLQARGYAVINLEYRRDFNSYTSPAPTPTTNAGGRPGTFNDIINGIDALTCDLLTKCGAPTSPALDTSRIAVVGHSAGGQLALWRALEEGMPADRDTSNGFGQVVESKLKPRVAVGQAAVSDMYDACLSNTASCSAVAGFLDVSTFGELDAASPYFSPFQMLAGANAAAIANGTNIDIYMEHGASDTLVFPVQSTNFATEAGTFSNILAEPDPFATSTGGHFNVIDPQSTDNWINTVVPFLQDKLVPACTVDADCDDNVYCNGVETCSAGTCQSGTPVDCDDGVACTVDTCNEATDSCDNVATNSLCDDGLFCNGVETCDAANDCQAGTAVDCDDGISCTLDSCNEATDSCDNVPADSLCDDGVFCNGVETCDAGLGCQAGTTVDCDDGVLCTVDSCNEATDSCDNVATDSLCDDGLFCNGVETCDVVSDCQAGTDPCPGQSCDEPTDQCVACLVDADCDDGVYCNGVETCNSGVCQAGTVVDCDDGVLCTVDSCNETTDSCDNIATDSLCDDGVFCNGAETCDAALGCQAGTTVDCDDGVSCTVDSCNEGTDSCDNVATDSICDDGLFCNGAETCDAVNDCQSGTAVDCDDGVSCTIDSCNEATDSCDNVATDSLCDDGLFCNGVETCDAVNDCQSGSDPCSAGETCDEGTDTCAVPAGDPIISEVHPNPVNPVSDQDGEFIEIYNPFASPITLTGANYEICDSSNNNCNTLAGTIAANGYYVICRNSAFYPECDFDVNFGLNNRNGEIVRLRKDGSNVDSVTYPSARGANAGLSYARDGTITPFCSCYSWVTSSIGSGPFRRRRSLLRKKGE